jgi:hypothetical protein
MKKIQLLFGLLVFTCLTSQAQISVNVNLGTPPVWAPAERVESQYYYLPDINAYYDVPAERFIYARNGSWIRSASLPYQYRNYNLRGGNVVYLTDYRGNAPYKFYKSHKMKYPKKMKYKEPYFDNKGGNNGNGNGKSQGNGKGKGNGNGKGKK